MVGGGVEVVGFVATVASVEMGGVSVVSAMGVVMVELEPGVVGSGVEVVGFVVTVASVEMDVGSVISTMGVMMVELEPGVLVCRVVVIEALISNKRNTCLLLCSRPWTAFNIRKS